MHVATTGAAPRVLLASLDALSGAALGAGATTLLLWATADARVTALALVCAVCAIAVGAWALLYSRSGAAALREADAVRAHAHARARLPRAYSPVERERVGDRVHAVQRSLAADPDRVLGSAMDPGDAPAPLAAESSRKLDSVWSTSARAAMRGTGDTVARIAEARAARARSGSSDARADARARFTRARTPDARAVGDPLEATVLRSAHRPSARAPGVATWVAQPSPPRVLDGMFAAPPNGWVPTPVWHARQRSPAAPHARAGNASYRSPARGAAAAAPARQAVAAPTVSTDADDPRDEGDPPKRRSSPPALESFAGATSDTLAPAPAPVPAPAVAEAATSASPSALRAGEQCAPVATPLAAPTSPPSSDRRVARTPQERREHALAWSHAMEVVGDKRYAVKPLAGAALAMRGASRSKSPAGARVRSTSPFNHSSERLARVRKPQAPPVGWYAVARLFDDT